MIFPHTVWNYSFQTEAERIAFTASHTANFFYTKNGFLVLPFPVSKNGNTVYLPKSSLPQLKKIKLSLIASPDKKTVSLVKKKLKIEPINFEALERDWQTKEKIFWKTFYEIFPQTRDKIDPFKGVLEIRPTAYGTISSFTPLGKIKDKIIIYLRQDANVDQIASSIISAFFYQELSFQEYDWREKMAVTAFIFTQTKLSQVFPNFKSTFYWVNQKENGVLSVASQNYLKELGLNSNNIFTLKRGSVYIKEKNTLEKFSLKERKILILLIQKKNNLCSIDEIAQALWENENESKFSPWAIAKIIQRLRNKIENQGITSTVIQTKRKEGYILID